MKIRERVPLQDFTTMRVGGEARFFCDVQTKKDLLDAFDFIEEKKISFFVLGGGSNVIFSDDGFDGVVLKINIDGISYEQKKDATLAIVGAGVCWDDFVFDTVHKDLCGLENLSYIPGTVGASPVQNIGAYGVEVKDVIESVEVFDIEKKVFRNFSVSECSFGYRDSFFKAEKGKGYIVTGVSFLLSKEKIFNLSYGSLQQKLDEKKIKEPTAMDVRNVVIETRKQKLPEVDALASSGSFFKNPMISQEEYKELVKKYPEVPTYPAENNMIKIPAGWLIDHVCHMRSVRRGQVGTYEKQALVIVNFGDASATDIKNFSKEIISCVKEKTGIQLEREVNYVE